MTLTPETESPEGGIDVIIPVYGAASDLERCLQSVFEHTKLPPHRVILVVDGPQGPDVETVLASRHSGGDAPIRVLRNQARRGFVASVNRGMAESSGDVVLLNSDTEVTADWLDGLRAAAYSAPDIATVTPLSNSATICSVPEFLDDNLMPEGLTVAEMARITSAVSLREYPRLPTGVGVCLYIRRAALDRIGLFDESRFGLGYGEENEFCIRATRAGFEHVADDATFVYHAGQKSFGPGKKRREKKAMRILRSVDRSYRRRIASFIREDPLRSIRTRITDRILEDGTPDRGTRNSDRLSILHLVHGWPPFAVGGTESYARQIATAQIRQHRVSVLARIADTGRATGQRLAYLDRGIKVRLIVNNFDQRNPIARNALKVRQFERELENFVGLVKPDLVHVHHLAGLGGSLMHTLSRQRIPVVYQIQDWWTLCARANLWHVDDTLCAGPDPARCASCLPLTKIEPRGPLNRILYRVRAAYLRRQVRSANAYLMGSRSVHDSYAEAGALNPKAPIKILDYGIPCPPEKPGGTEPGQRPLTFGCVGALLPHKGVHIAARAFRNIDPKSARLEIWGNSELSPEYTAEVRSAAGEGPVEIKGIFAEEQKQDVFLTMDVLLVPSVGLESFGIAAREAMAAGVPVIAARRGALAELEIDDVCGALVAPGDAGVLESWIDRLVQNSDVLARWRESLPQPTSVDDHVKTVEEIYRHVLGAPR